MIVFRTYNEALMWSRLERIVLVLAGIFLVAGVEYMSGSRSGTFTWVTLLIGQFIILKCWMDMITMSQPFKNCWAFKE